MNAWDRQEGETHKSYECFLRYLAFGPNRALRFLTPGKSVPGHITAWSAKWEWPERASAYDAYMASESLRKAASVRDSAFADLAKFARKAIQKLAEHMDSPDEKVSLRACTDYLDRMGVSLGAASVPAARADVECPQIPEGVTASQRDDIFRRWCAKGTPERLVELERLSRDASLPPAKRADIIELLNSYGGLAVPRRVEIDPKREATMKQREEDDAVDALSEEQFSRVMEIMREVH